MNEIFDLEFNKIQDLKWLPFVGANYEKAEKKVLVIGESHYSNEQEINENFNNQQFTRWIVQEMGIDEEEYKAKFFTNINKMFLTKNNTSTFWNKISFYNFIQSTLGNIKTRPTKKDFLLGWDVFIKVVGVVKPEYCLFFGNSAADYFNDFAKKNNLSFKPIEWKERIGRTYLKKGTLTLNDKEIKLIFVKHPSKFFSSDSWYKAIENENSELLSFLIKNRNK